MTAKNVGVGAVGLLLMTLAAPVIVMLRFLSKIGAHFRKHYADAG